MLIKSVITHRQIWIQNPKKCKERELMLVTKRQTQLDEQANPKPLMKIEILNYIGHHYLMEMDERLTKMIHDALVGLPRCILR
ncbi:hypothetical protein KFK09_027541 [Dendrobium nobile]|uniref:Uncharacterized protein n=1 Tax=Dendrobium nobile TaxID=94219 RepID=A0A8T3AGA1_DENNO|nr:hypothetical protein KFK09_027541 [Dendrobium nobile]